MIAVIFIILGIASGHTQNMDLLAEENVKACQKIIVETIGRPIANEIDTALVQYRNLTSSISFTRGTLGEIGSFDENYKQYFVCTAVNGAGEIISLDEINVRLHFLKESSLHSEHSENYAGNSNNYFYLIRFVRDDGGEFVYKDKVKFTNEQLYNYYIGLEDLLDKKKR